MIYLTVEVTIGKLRQVVLQETAISNFDFSKFKIIGECQLIRGWEHYGRHRSYEMKIYLNGEDLPIELNGYKFDNKIYYEEKLVNNQFTSFFKLNGVTSEGKVFEIALNRNGNEILESIIYAIVYISYLGPEKGLEYWDHLRFTYYFENRYNLSSQLDIIRNIKSSSKRIIDNYPFMEFFIQEGIHELLKVAKKSLDSLELFK